MLEAAAWYQQISFKWLSTSVLDSVFLNNLLFLSSNKQQLLLPHSESKASVHSRMHRLLVPKVWALLKGLPLPPPNHLVGQEHRKRSRGQLDRSLMPLALQIGRWRE